MEADRKQIIYHIFPGDLPFHVLGMLKVFIKNFGEKSFFIVAGVTAETKSLYEDVFTSFQFNRYQIVMGDNIITEYSLLQRCLVDRKLMYNSDKELIRYMKGLPKTTSFLVHGLTSRWLNVQLRMQGFKNINWVCWGFWYYNNSRTLRAFITNSFDHLNYSLYKNIICLMPQDIEDIKNQLKSRAVFFHIPYPGINRELAEYALKNQVNRHAGIKVLLGNSGHSIKQYDSFLRSLRKIGGHYKITCMVSYGADENQIETFKSAYKVFLEREELLLLTTMLSKQDYALMLNSFDVYVSPVDSQTGLAAIYLSMALGKKIYLQGNNYEYVKQLGAVVYHTREFESDMENERFFLNEKEKEVNKMIVAELLDDNSVIPKWNGFFNHIS